MPNRELLIYIQQKIDLGLTPENVRTILTTNGWKEEEVTQAFQMIKDGVLAVPEKIQKREIIKLKMGAKAAWLVVGGIFIVSAFAIPFFLGILEVTDIKWFISRITTGFK